MHIIKTVQAVSPHGPTITITAEEGSGLRLCTDGENGRIEILDIALSEEDYSKGRLVGWIPSSWAILPGWSQE